ncbi:MAG: DUF1178 family protein [Sphingomonadaceae bacterium]
MIVFDLNCPAGHRFEGWFGSSRDYDEQLSKGLLTCPQCGSSQICKAPMAPAVPIKGNKRDMAPRLSESETMAQGTDTAPAAPSARTVSGGQIPPQVMEAMRALADAQAKALKESKWVGDDFAQQSRAMHYGEQELEAIHGKATLEEAKELLEEGVPVAPVLFPLASPDELN